MRRAVVVVVALVLLALVMQKVCRRGMRCGCIETCLCRDRATCTCEDPETAPPTAG